MFSNSSQGIQAHNSLHVPPSVHHSKTPLNETTSPNLAETCPYIKQRRYTYSQYNVHEKSEPRNESFFLRMHSIKESIVNSYLSIE